jgi:hypothetical protein
MNHTLPESELSLLALRYAANELDAVETAQFEQRLAAELDAQLALAQVVQVSAALRPEWCSPVRVVRSADVQPAGRSRRWTRWLAVLSSGVVAATALVAVLDESVPDGASLSADSGATRAMVSGWAAVELENSGLLTSDDAALLVLDQDAPAMEDIPDWLLAAVEIGDAPSASPDSGPGSGDDPDSIDEDT